MNESPLAFDRAVDLEEMLRVIPRRAFESAMQLSLGPAWRLADPAGKTVREGAQPFDGEACSQPLVVDIEQVGLLSAPADRQAWLPAAAKWVEMMLGASNRYRMAADLHIEAVYSDHRELTAKHAALAESEARYRALSAQLEERVREQVGLIEQTQRRMYQAEKMASVGNLAAGMAHEINNPIGFIRSNLSTAQRYVATLQECLDGAVLAPGKADKAAFVFEDFASLLDESIGGADRVARIVADLKAYAGSGAAHMKVADPNEAVCKALRMLGELPPGVVLEQQLDPLPALVCDSEGLNRVVLALLLNARTAMNGRQGAIRIETAERDGEAVITVADQGCGIDERVIGRIFDPFFTTQDVGAGMGLGLTVASDVVRAHSGHIGVQSVPGQGSTFCVRIPVKAGAIGKGEE